VTLKHGLPPVVAIDTRVLLLGSFPGEESLRQRQYYAHPRNQFWRLVGDVIGEPLPLLPYAQRLERLLENRIGLWDVITRCTREGSLDADIRNAEGSDFARVRRRAPRLAVVAFNGQTAARAEGAWRAHGVRTFVLPSSSPAYTLPYERKLAAWRAIAPPLGPTRLA
jgi:hypoxanthine-DNA glycosylase